MNELANTFHPALLTWIVILVVGIVVYFIIKRDKKIERILREQRRAE